jgi:hypothetical protein
VVYLALKKSITVKVSAELKKEIEQLAKKRGIRPTQLVLEWVETGLIQCKPSKEIFERIVETIKNNGMHIPDGVLELEIKPSKNAVIYVPDVWCISNELLSKLIKVPKPVLQLAAADLTEYNLIDPESKNKFTSSLIRHLVKTLNMYTVGGAQNLNRAIEKVFKYEVPDPIILARKINPIRLTKICEANPGRKVVYVFDLKEFGEHAQVR